MERAASSVCVQLRRILSQWSHKKCILRFSQRNFTMSRPSLAIFKTTEAASKDDIEKKEDEGEKTFVTQKASWMSKFLGGQKMETGTESHSNRLAVKDVVYELTFHKVKPDSMDRYLDEYENLTHMIKKWNTGGDHIGSWTVEVGDLDEAIHLWRFKGGYQTLDRHKSILRNEQEFKDFRKRRNILLRSRVNQTLLAFSFWCNIQQRPGNNNIYELRSYTLKPGTMIDWGNSWAQGLKYRQTDHESVAGFFSHIGDLYKAHHLWAYESLAAREEVRDMAWEREGWHECVAYTVPLVHSMVSRILIPTSFSPLK